MNHTVTWFEIPVNDMARAKLFYSNLLDADLIEENMSMPDGSEFKAAVIAAPDNCVTGMLINGKGYSPSDDSAVIYLNGGKDIEVRLAAALQAGAEPLIPKTAIEDGNKGYFCQFKDTEGNRIGLYSPPQ